MPIGDSVPCGVSTVTESPTATPSFAARSLPSRMPSSIVRAAWRRASSRLPLRIAPADVGDARLERRIDALDADELLRRRRADRAPCPRIAGAAPTTCGNCRSLRDLGAGSRRCRPRFQT